MIRSLHISNYALISEIDIDFTAGLNIITGETGAGKSIMLSALNLLLGGRADTRAIKDASRKSVIEIECQLENPDDFTAFFETNGLDNEGDTVILRRELAPNGRSRAFINDSPVTITTLRELAIQLVDIHSQHQNLLLADPDFQLQIIDSLADNAGLLTEYKTAYADYLTVLKKYSTTRDTILKGRDEADFIAYQLEELQNLGLQAGEQSELENERDSLSENTDLKQIIAEALSPMSEENGVLDDLSISATSIRELSETFEDAEQLADRLDNAVREIRDIANVLERYDSDLKADPERLEDIEARLSRIYSLELKHHVDTDSQLIALADKLAEQKDAIENGDQILEELEHEARMAKKHAVLIARQISERRQQCARNFAAELQQAAGPLGMKNLRCEIAVTAGKLNPHGMDKVDFLFAFNKNQELMPVGQTASGGEISRLMLTIKTIIGEKMNLPSIIFDEIDTGVSGEVASKMGEMMQRLSHKIQVITITHLPQVAARGLSHYKVYKEDDERSTTTRIRRLDESQRIDELALMLSGSSDDDAAVAAARSLIDNYKE